jgi:hypothetical protein
VNYYYFVLAIKERGLIVAVAVRYGSTKKNFPDVCDHAAQVLGFDLEGWRRSFSTIVTLLSALIEFGREIVGQ